MKQYSYNNLKTVSGGSTYRYVEKRVDPKGNPRWFAKLPNRSGKEHQSEREADLAVDMVLIKDGKEPVNILKRIT